MDSEIAGIDQFTSTQNVTVDDIKEDDVILKHFEDFQMQMALAFQYWDDIVHDVWSEKKS